MSRYTGPSWKQSRRYGISLTGSGKEIARRNYVPGQHGPNNRSKLSEYGLQLAEKQKLRFTYGLSERQFRNLYVAATKVKEGTVGYNFMTLLEQRLDNVVYRLGLATTRRQARQFVNHGHILVDGKRVDIPSFRVQPGQVISVREKSMKVPAILEAAAHLPGARRDHLPGRRHLCHKSLKLLKLLKVALTSYHLMLTNLKELLFVFLNVMKSTQKLTMLLSSNSTTK